MDNYETAAAQENQKIQLVPPPGLTKEELTQWQIVNAQPELVTTAIAGELALLDARKAAGEPGTDRSEYDDRCRLTVDAQAGVRQWASECAGLARASKAMPTLAAWAWENYELGDDSPPVLAVNEWVGSSYAAAIRSELTKRGSPGSPEVTPDTTPVAAATAEQVQTPAFFDDIVRWTHTRTRIDTNMFDGQRYLGDQPEEVAERWRIGIPEKVITDESAKSADWHDQPDEVVAFTELSGDGVGEDRTVRLRYQYAFTPKTTAAFREKYPGAEFIKRRFTEGQGSRDGKLMVCVDLPGELADRLQSHLKNHDPASIRTLVRQLLEANNNGELPKDRVADRAKYPPYDLLPPDWQITMLTGREHVSETGFIEPFTKSEQLRLTRAAA